MTSDAPTSPARPPFNPVDTTLSTSLPADDLESPSLTNGNALARFEFEPNRSNKNGTKVLMVEWEEDASTSTSSAPWEISWPGSKPTTLPSKSITTTSSHQQPTTSSSLSTQDPPQPQGVNRLYFLLGPGIPIPTNIHLRKGPSIAWKTSPLPAIFAPELGATARQAGKKGVLHTIWAKKRLQVLQEEIDRESQINAEGIGLEMAIAEKEWIESNFGVTSRGSGGGGLAVVSASAGTLVPPGPASPKSPGGGRLLEKLKGLKLGTGARDLETTTTDGSEDLFLHNPLSPESSDVAVGSFGGFAALKGQHPSSPSASTTAANKSEAPPPPQQKAMKPQCPPNTLTTQPSQQIHPQSQTTFASFGMSSLNALASPSHEASVSSIPRSSAAELSQAHRDDEQQQDADDLFALPMSPRSPDMAKSPFSFAVGDTGRYLRG